MRRDDGMDLTVRLLAEGGVELESFRHRSPTLEEALLARLRSGPEGAEEDRPIPNECSERRTGTRTAN